MTQAASPLIVSHEPLLSLYVEEVSPGEMLAPELPEPLEILGIGDYVHVTPHYMKKPYFAWVEVVNAEAGRVIVSHWSFGYVNEHGIEEVKLVLKKSAVEAEAPTA